MKESQRVNFRHQKIGFAFQSNNLVPLLNVRENGELLPHLNGMPVKGGRQRVYALLARLGLDGRVANIIDDRCAIDTLATSNQYGAEEAIPVEPVSALQVLKPAYAF
jgi:ABC-type taurine transport system ATPase subunit